MLRECFLIPLLGQEGYKKVLKFKTYDKCNEESLDLLWKFSIHFDWLQPLGKAEVFLHPLGYLQIKWETNDYFIEIYFKKEIEWVFTAGNTNCLTVFNENKEDRFQIFVKALLHFDKEYLHLGLDPEKGTAALHMKEIREETKKKLEWFETDNFYALYNKIVNYLKTNPKDDCIDSEDLLYQTEKFNFTEEEFRKFVNVISIKGVPDTKYHHCESESIVRHKEIKIRTIHGQGTCHQIKINDLFDPNFVKQEIPKALEDYNTYCKSRKNCSDCKCDLLCTICMPKPVTSITEKQYEALNKLLDLARKGLL